MQSNASSTLHTPLPPPPIEHWGCSWQNVMSCSPFQGRPWLHSTRNNTNAVESLLGGCRLLMCHWGECTDWKGIQMVSSTVPQRRDEDIINNWARTGCRAAFFHAFYRSLQLHIVFSGLMLNRIGIPTSLSVLYSTTDLWHVNQL